MRISKDASGEAWPEQIKRARVALRLTQEDLARALEVTVSTINRWENGHAAPSRMAQKALQSFLASQEG